MQNSILGVGLALVASALTLPAFAQQSAKHPDLSGVWLAEGAAATDVRGHDQLQGRTQSQWLVGKLPLTPEGLARYQANEPSKGNKTERPGVKPIVSNDPLGGGNPIGLYRDLIFSRPMEFDIVPGKVIQLFSFERVFRIIYTDGRPVPDDVPEGPFWYGYSVGHWEGDTLVVNTLALDSRQWLDEWGTPIDDNARVEERWHLLSHDQLQLTFTVTDPALYTKPWTTSPIIFYLRPHREPNEFIVAPIDEAQIYEGAPGYKFVDPSTASSTGTGAWRTKSGPAK